MFSETDILNMGTYNAPFVDLFLSSNEAHFMPRTLKTNKTRPILQFHIPLHVSLNKSKFSFILFFCDLFILKEKQRQIQIQKHMTCIYTIYIDKRH